MLHGACLCGAVRFEIERAAGPFELCHCSRCLEIPAGLLDDDPGLRPDKHIFVERRSAWFEIADALPRFTKQEIVAERRRLAGARGFREEPKP
jgi:hypothetical protein